MIACIAKFLAASAYEKNWEDVEANDNNEESMLAHRGNILSGFSVPPLPPGAPDAKTAVKSILAGPAMSKAKRYWRK
jgi:hypothetical protein